MPFFNIDQLLKEIDDTIGADLSRNQTAASSIDLAADLVARGVSGCDAALLRTAIADRGRQSLIEAIVETGVDEAALVKVLAERARLPFVRVTPDLIDAIAAQRLGFDFCRERGVVPIMTDGTRVQLGTTTADDVFLLDEAKRRLGVSAVKHVLVCPSDVAMSIKKLDASDDADVEAILADVDEDDVEVRETETESADLEAEAASSPIVRYVNHIIQTAFKEGASDIHLEPGEQTLRVRMRIDGELFEMMSPPRKMHAALTSRIKIMANLDIAERRLPQDGRIRVTVMERNLDLRVSTIPTSHGEKTVLRILDEASIQVSLNELGFSETMYQSWSKQITQPHGIILVTGPTGSGKTTTLYTSIGQMDTDRMNISTVEDPVEYNLPGITQIQTHSKIDMTFSRALKSLLRQDPDVVMVGEIRDAETAAIAIEAALTGHLVLSTLHTNDAPSSITRLINMGAEPFLVGAALNAVLAQRLVRKICSSCASPIEETDAAQTNGIDNVGFVAGKGCDACRGTGYSGRLGIYELLELNDHLRDHIASSPNVTEFRRLCRQTGMQTLREDGLAKAHAGRTTVEEVLRVTESSE